jgi:sugar lactone lactonase YvrE
MVMDRRFRWVSGLAALLCLALAGPASAHVYWSEQNWLGRANLDGSRPSLSFLSASSPMGIAVSGRKLYWANAGASSIGRVDVDGSGANPKLVSVPNFPVAVAVDDAHVYWADYLGNAIGRANLDGSGVNPRFIPLTGSPLGVAVSARHIYWTIEVSHAIGRANIDGSLVQPSFITGASNPTGLAVDGQHLYWASSFGNTIGRSNLDGSGAERSFIAGANRPLAVAVDGQHVYWTNGPTDRPGTIGRASLDGSGADQSFVPTGQVAPWGVAVDGGPAGTASPSAQSLAFGTQLRGTLSDPRALTISNTGHGELAVDAVRVAGDDSDDFIVSADTCSHTTLAIGTTCTVRVRFGPSASGARHGQLVVTGNDPSAPLEVALDGSGEEPRQAPAGAAGPAGEAGAPGAAAPAPPAAPRAELRVSVCRTVKAHRRCAPRRVSGAALPAAAASASLMRGAVVYATGTARGGRLVLDARRAVPAGSYMLKLRYRRAGRRTTARQAISIR